METVVILLYSWENRKEMNMDGVPCACLSYLPCHLIYIIKHNKYFNILLIQFPSCFFFLSCDVFVWFCHQGTTVLIES